MYVGGMAEPSAYCLCRLFGSLQLCKLALEGVREVVMAVYPSCLETREGGYGSSRERTCDVAAEMRIVWTCWRLKDG